MHAPHTEHLYLVVHAGHEPEELLAVFVPFDGVQPGLLQIIMTSQAGRLTQYQLLRQSQTSHAQRPTT